MAYHDQHSPRLLLSGDKLQNGSRGMKLNHVFLIAVLILALPLSALAQAQQPEEPGRVWGDYTVHASVEFGGHIADSEGNQGMYQTLVDINSGPRLLEQELTMQSNSRVGGLFDNLYTSSFGFGGDPNGMARLRLEKHHWYNFVANYRRDKNVFDYDLFGNPLNLNAGIVTCGAGCSNAFTPSALPWFSNSTRTQWVTRNMGDFALTLLPQSKVSVRLGYSRNASYGAIANTLEAPLRSILLEDSQWKSDRYNGGVDIKYLPRTTISLDFFWEHDKNDIGFTDALSQIYTLGNATGQQLLFNGAPMPVDIGLLYPPISGVAAGSGTTPCPSGAPPSLQTIFTGNVFLLNPGCGGILVNSGLGGAYFRTGNVRTDIPTGQFSLQSNYFRKLDITASATYSSASSDFLNYNEFAHLNSAMPGAPTPPATISTSNSSLFLINGAPSADRVSANADAGVTYHISKSLSVSDKFRWLNWREPGNALLNQFGCWLPNTTYATAAGTTGTFASLLNPCNPAILALINPAGSTLIGTAGSVTAGRGNYQQTAYDATIVGERSYFNTIKVNWQPTRKFSGYVGYRFARRSFQDGNADVTGILGSITANFVNNGTGLPPTVPQCNVATAGCDPATGLISNLGTVDSAELNQHTLLVGSVIRLVEAWRINADLEFSTAGDTFTLIYPRHQQRARLYTTYKLKPWLSVNGGIHIVESRNNFAATTAQDDNGANPGGPLFPSTKVVLPFYGHKDHWRYYTLGTTVTRGRVTLDAGWTMQDQNINSATCMPVPANAFTGGLSAPLPCLNGTTARAMVLNYFETTHTGYTDISFQPVKRVTVSLGYSLTSDNGATNWLRADNGLPLQVVGDIFGNSPVLAGNPISPCPGPSNSAGCLFPGPFPDQPLGPQATNWTNAHAGIAVEVVRGVQFKGFWNYYDYNSKDHPPSLALLTVTQPRDFHANVGTISLRYSF
jgi:hypothetical protein